MTELETELIKWLKTRDPADWHKVAIQYNWEYGINPLWWMIQQDACYKATALHIFWYAEPEFYLAPENQSDDTYMFMPDLRHMLATIINRWNAGKYSNSKYGFRDNAIYSYEDCKALSDSYGDEPAPFVVPSSMFEPLNGEKITPDHENFPEGIPSELWHLLD